MGETKLIIDYGRRVYKSGIAARNGRISSMKRALKATIKLLKNGVVHLDNDPIHTWFELSYAQYLTIPRSVLQSMPPDWQFRFTQCLNELDEYDWRPKGNSCYRVSLWKLNDNGDWLREEDDPLMDYERGRRRVEMKKTRWFDNESKTNPDR